MTNKNSATIRNMSLSLIHQVSLRERWRHITHLLREEAW